MGHREPEWWQGLGGGMSQDVWTYSVPVMVRRGAPAKLDRSYA